MRIQQIVMIRASPVSTNDLQETDLNANIVSTLTDSGEWAAGDA